MGPNRRKVVASRHLVCGNPVKSCSNMNDQQFAQGIDRIAQQAAQQLVWLLELTVHRQMMFSKKFL